MVIDITEEELQAINSCVYMAAREGFYDYNAGRTKIESILKTFYVKLGYDENTIKDICDEQ